MKGVDPRAGDGQHLRGSAQQRARRERGECDNGAEIKERVQRRRGVHRPGRRAVRLAEGGRRRKKSREA